MSLQGVYNMPSGVPFLRSLAEGLMAEFGEQLSDALILLPTRRAVRGLTELFLQISQEQGQGVMLMPRLNTLADIDPNEPPFEPSDVAGLVPQAIDGTQRRFEMAKIVERFYRRASDMPLDAAAALALADPLLTILDDAASEETRISDLAELSEIQAFAAQHFQHAAELYKIIQTYWPERLRELDALEPKARQVEVLDKLTEQWQESPPNYPIIIAGSTGTLGATARLMACVSHLPRGVIILPGLDNSPERSWENVAEQHPQNSLKNLLGVFGLDRGDVLTWPHITGIDPARTSKLAARRLLLAESLVPVDNTADWLERIATIRRNAPDTEPFVDAMEGLSVLEAANDEDEALTIALLMRETLEEPGQTAALVTPDQGLARRVKARLRRWKVDVDISQGEPLEETPVGGFLTAIVDLLGDPESPVALAVLLNHPLTHLGAEFGAVKREWQSLEKRLYRGVRPDMEEIEKKDKSQLIARLSSALMPLTDLGENASVKEWAQKLREVALDIASLEEGAEKCDGAARLRGASGGREGDAVLQSLIDFGHNLRETTPAGLSRLLAVLMRGKVVRPPFGTHPRLSILGPLEARMLSADRIILGGLNEGVWPATPKVEPFLSRAMRKSVGLSLPEKRFGLSAHDFAELAAHSNVVLTRAKRSGGSPMVASRWLWRLQTLLRGALGETRADSLLSAQDHYLRLAEALDNVTPDEIKNAQIEPPKPAPPVKDRWAFGKGRRVSITQVKTWIRDPYSIFAKHTLGLKSLDPLDAALGAGDFGTAIHDGLEQFLRVHKEDWSKQTESKLIEFLKQAFIESGYVDFEIAKETKRFEAIATEFYIWLRERQTDGFDAWAIESEAEHYIKELDFTLSGKADLIERRPEGYGVIDYKTGAPPSVKVVKAGFDPQLPLSAWLLAQGGFKEVKKGQTIQLGYVRIKGSNNDFSHQVLTSPEQKNGLSAEEYAQDAIDVLGKLVRAYDDPKTAYYSQPRIQYTHDYGDYDDLARRGEWASLGGEGER